MNRIALALSIAVLSAPAGCTEEKKPTSAEPSASVTAVPTVSAPAAPSASAAIPMPKTIPTAITAQHVLVAWKDAKGAPPTVKRSKPEAKKRADEVASKARGGADFSALVAEYSDDPGSKERRGSVGKFTPEKMTKPFSDAAFALGVDETSAVVESDFGFHIIKRNQ